MRRQMVRKAVAVALPGLLFGLGCTSQPFTGQYEGERWSADECLECHGTRTPSDDPAAIAEDIVSTHYDDWRFDGDGNFVTTPTGAGDGYILDPDKDWALAVPGPPVELENFPGYVTRGDARQCGLSCHNQHDDLSLQRKQYAASKHADRGAFWLSEAWGGFPTSVCFRCHSGVGYALYTDPTTSRFPPPVQNRVGEDEDPPGDMIHCNTCHLGTGLPSGRNPRLRVQGEITVSAGSGGPPPNTLFVDGTIDVGRNATCLVCHVGRQSGGSLFKTMSNAGTDPYDGVDETFGGVQFVDPHYQAAGATLHSMQAYELQGRTYTAGNLFHQGSGCIGCHMFDHEDEDYGGHSFKVTSSGGRSFFDNPTCTGCHGDSNVARDISRLGPRIDADGDGTVEKMEDELHGLYEAIYEELGTQGIHKGDGFPYFFTTPDPDAQGFPTWARTWTESQHIAAFNAYFFEHDTGIQFHNYIYAVQVLRDSLENLTGTPLGGARPSSAFDRPATNYAR